MTLRGLLLCWPQVFVIFIAHFWFEWIPGTQRIHIPSWVSVFNQKRDAPLVQVAVNLSVVAPYQRPNRSEGLSAP